MGKDEVSLSPVSFYSFFFLYFSLFMFFAAFLSLTTEIWYKSLGHLLCSCIFQGCQEVCVWISDAEAGLQVSNLGPAMVKQYAADTCIECGCIQFSSHN